MDHNQHNRNVNFIWSIFANEWRMDIFRSTSKFSGEPFTALYRVTPSRHHPKIPLV